jgi:hypothetical protein
LHDAVINLSYFVDVANKESGRHQKFRSELISLDFLPLDSLRRLIVTPVDPNVFVDVESHTLVEKEVR